MRQCPVTRLNHWRRPRLGNRPAGAPFANPNRQNAPVSPRSHLIRHGSNEGIQQHHPRGHTEEHGTYRSSLTSPKIGTRIAVRVYVNNPSKGVQVERYTSNRGAPQRLVATLILFTIALISLVWKLAATLRVRVIMYADEITI